MAIPSNKEKKRSIRAGVDALRLRPGWDPSEPGAGKAELAHAQQADRSATVYARSDDCGACEQERASTGDSTALCEEHLAAAMGV